MWTGSAEANGTYTFTNSSEDISNYDMILIDYCQLNISKCSNLLDTDWIQKGVLYDVILWGYSTRYTSMHFIDHGFVIDNLCADGGYYSYIKKIIGIKL